MSQPTFIQVLWEYLRIVIAYWWVLLPGITMPLIDVVNWPRPQEKKIKVSLSMRLTIALSLLTLAQFLAYRNAVGNLSTVIEEKRQKSIEIDSLNAENAFLEKPAPECWVQNKLGPVDAAQRQYGLLSATEAILHCNHKIDAPYRVEVRFDRDFVPGSMETPETPSGVDQSGRPGRDLVYVGHVASHALLPAGVLVVTVYGRTDQYPRALDATITSSN